MTDKHRDRFIEKARVDATGCWIWQGYIDRNGYGYYRHEQTNWAHRASWLIFRGPIPEEMTIDHLCRVKACVNPDHLDVVTQGTNNKRSRQWTKCVEYHPTEPSRWAERADGRRRCLECHRVSEQRRRDAWAVELAAKRTA